MPAYHGSGGFESFDDFLARVFGVNGPSQGNFGRQVRRIDITQLLSKRANKMVSQAARHAGEQGHGELDALHLLWAATQHDPGRGMLSNAGADPDAVARAVSERLPQAS
ncbi:Clp protease N-terminal domain-containing protein, partial [Saccharomonospora iraqiensis]|uniref:Clp protease N-terminal domain-containing protein n=1 Tax=Saccharomonospora iraqiensis TaxID=52698 RepID=UPI0004787F64